MTTEQEASIAAIFPCATYAEWHHQVTMVNLLDFGEEETWRQKLSKFLRTELAKYEQILTQAPMCEKKEAIIAQNFDTWATKSELKPRPKELRTWLEKWLHAEVVKPFRKLPGSLRDIMILAAKAKDVTLNGDFLVVMVYCYFQQYGLYGLCYWLREMQRLGSDEYIWAFEIVNLCLECSHKVSTRCDKFQDFCGCKHLREEMERMNRQGQEEKEGTKKNECNEREKTNDERHKVQKTKQKREVPEENHEQKKRKCKEDVE